MDLERIVSELKNERDRLSNAIALLESGANEKPANASVVRKDQRKKPDGLPKRRDSMSAVGRAHQIAATKLRWKRWRKERNK